MKKKKLAIIVSVAIVVALGIGVIWHSIPVDMMNVDVEKVATIKVQNGNTGELLEITNREDISHLIDCWNCTSLSRQKISLGKVGYSLRITMLDENGNELSGWNNFYINTESVMRKDPFFYNIRNGYLEYDYIQQLFENSN